jgi:hypothetical protein
LAVEPARGCIGIFERLDEPSRIHGKRDSKS